MSYYILDGIYDVQSTKETSWSIIAWNGATISSSWLITNRVVQTVDSSWGIQAWKTATVIVSWSILNWATATISTGWRIYNKLSTNTKYDISPRKAKRILFAVSNTIFKR